MKDLIAKLNYILDKCGYIGLSKINGSYNIDFGGYCGQKGETFDIVLTKCIELIDSWKGF